MWTVAIWFFLIMYAINGFALFLDDVVDDYSMVDPFTNSTLNSPSQPNIDNIYGNLTSNTQTNSTGGDSIFIWDTIEYGWNSTIFVWDMLTGGFIFNTLESFIPDAGDTAQIFEIFQGTIFVFLILTGLHFWRGIL